MKTEPASNPTNFPDKLFYKIGEVSRITEVPTHVLRFWESEFPAINPKRTAAGQRKYSRRDVDTILQIKELLYQKKFTIPGARRQLRSPGEESEAGLREALEAAKSELRRIRDLLA
jgi:DNA-binding transcriptional MerR regulator